MTAKSINTSVNYDWGMSNRGLTRRELAAFGAVAAVSGGISGFLARSQKATDTTNNSVGPINEPGIRKLCNNGAWTFFGQPRSVYADGKTFVGFVTREGDVKIVSYNHARNETTEATLESNFDADDHASPTLHVRSSDQRLLAFWDRSRDIHYTISDRPLDVSSFREVKTYQALNPNYASPVQLPGENNRMYLFYRSGPDGANEHRYITSEDGGETWSSEVVFVRRRANRRIYANMVREGSDRLHFIFSNHPRDTDHKPPFNIWYCYYEDGSWYKADGTLIADETEGELPMHLTDLDLVYDWSEPGNSRAWLHDIAVESDGTPVLLFATFPSDTDHRYQHARWDRTEWVVNEIAAAGSSIADGDNPEDQYSGGIVFDRSEPSRVWFSEEVTDNQFEIREAVSSDTGQSWDVKEITSGSTSAIQKNVRPQYVKNEDGHIKVVFLQGEYHHYLDYDTDLMAMHRTESNRENQTTIFRKLC